MGHSASDACMVHTLEYFQHILMCPGVRRGACSQMLSRPLQHPSQHAARRRDRRASAQYVAGPPSRCAPVVHALACQDPTH